MRKLIFENIGLTTMLIGGLVVGLGTAIAVNTGAGAIVSGIVIFITGICAWVGRVTG